MEYVLPEWKKTCIQMCVSRGETFLLHTIVQLIRSLQCDLSSIYAKMSTQNLLVGYTN